MLERWACCTSGHASWNIFFNSLSRSWKLVQRCPKVLQLWLVYGKLHWQKLSCHQQVYLSAVCQVSFRDSGHTMYCEAPSRGRRQNPILLGSFSATWGLESWLVAPGRTQVVRLNWTNQGSHGKVWGTWTATAYIRQPKNLNLSAWPKFNPWLQKRSLW